MKSFDHLFEAIAGAQNLFEAARKAMKAKRFSDCASLFCLKLESEVFTLQDELINGSYTPGKYREFYIYEPKKRKISAAPFRDRVVHHALCNIIGPVFEQSFIYDSYANRSGKGSHKAIRRCQEFMRKYRFVLKADIRKYFPSIDHQILKDQIFRKIRCERTRNLISTIIDRSNPQEEVLYYFPGDHIFTPVERRKGLPIGNLTSQYFGNIYLNEFDHFIKEQLRVKGYIRYVDDFLLFHNDKSKLNEWKDEIEGFIGSLRLCLHHNKTQVRPVRLGITFLGQRIFDTHRLLRNENVRKCRHRINRQIVKLRSRLIRPSDIEASLNSWLGHAKQADTYKLRKKLIDEILEKGLNLVQTPRGSWRLLEQQTQELPCIKP
ncbi:MAG: RNA-directed DNA polymerase [Bacteroidales bacterium]|nr:RNA-directed DNA polymerase [Bacteroidales bacterium]